VNFFLYDFIIGYLKSDIDIDKELKEQAICFTVTYYTMIVKDKNNQEMSLMNKNLIQIISKESKFNEDDYKIILESIKDKIPKYYHEIDINDLGITNEYLFNKVKENKLPKSKEVLKVTEISIPESEELDTKHFSKETHNLIDKNTYDNLQLGLKVHEILELLDLKNPNLDLIDDEFIKEKVSKFLTNDILKDIDKSRIYKEHEFIYTKENIEYHGIIDLMIEYDDHIDIIDYKLNNIKDENYLNQLNGYKEYISDLTKKETNIYLYSIIGETLEKL
jgi:hypothetical protein